ncbi:hypothetical protein ACM26W_08775 [Halomonas sp. HK25]|uniref:hypothetical protein n=1 Tax=Halomonas sp. HK25 TaxID=3394321 RepID=UPI0039FCA340
MADVLAVLDALALDRVHYLGYSMGGIALMTRQAHRLTNQLLSFIPAYRFMPVLVFCAPWRESALQEVGCAGS